MPRSRPSKYAANPVKFNASHAALSGLVSQANQRLGWAKYASHHGQDKVAIVHIKKAKQLIKSYETLSGKKFPYHD